MSTFVALIWFWLAVAGALASVYFFGYAYALNRRTRAFDGLWDDSESVEKKRDVLDSLELASLSLAFALAIFVVLFQTTFLLVAFAVVLLTNLGVYANRWRLKNHKI